MFSRLFAILLLGLCLAPFSAARAVDMPKQYTDEFASAVIERFTPVSSPAPQPLPPLLMEDTKEQSVTLKDFQGRYVLLNLWATWCAPCVREMPALDNLVTHLDAKKITVIALNQNSNGHDITARFYAEHNLQHLALYVDPTGRAPSLTKAKGLPTTILIDPKGVEVGRWEGAIKWDSQNAIDFITARMTAFKPAQ
jgi:thiol-disulfide isomerase/thioredoxin